MSRYKFTPQNKQTYAILKTCEWFRYEHDSFQLISVSDRHVFYFVLRHLSPFGIALIHVMRHRSTALPGLSPFSPQKQKHYNVSILLISILHLLFVCLFAHITGHSSKIRTLSSGVRLKKMFVNNHLCLLINLLGKHF